MGTSDLRRITIVLIVGCCILVPRLLSAGTFPPQASVAGTTAIPHDDVEIIGWASSYSGYNPIGSSGTCDRGSNLTEIFETPEKALGPAGNSNGANEGFTLDVVSLGRDGCITLSFDTSIGNGPGWDFAVFENGFFVTLPRFGFLELAWIEVSSDGVNFQRFPAITQATAPVGPFSNIMDASDYDGLAGKYVAGFGTPFDLSDLPDNPLVDVNSITHVRVRDIVGNGSVFDNSSPPRTIFDPFATIDSAGFDLDAIAFRYSGQVDPTTVVAVPIPGWMIVIFFMLITGVFRKRQVAGKRH